MILEIIAVVILSMAVGAGIMKLALKIKKVERLVDRSEMKKYKAINNPEFLLKKLNENGIMVDDGDEISFSVEEKDGKKQLIQKIKKNTATTGVPKVAKKQPKKGEKNVRTKPKE